MKKITLVYLSLGIVLFVVSCQNEPTSPEPSQTDLPLSLAKKTALSFMANADDWFVLSQEPGEYTFAQFDVDGSDDDVTVMPNGLVLLKKRELSSPLRQDESGSSNFLNDNIDAVKITISARLNSEFNGRGRGTISITGSLEELTGTFEGSFSGVFSEHFFEGEYCAQGKTGDFTGMTMKGTMVEMETVDGGNDFILEGNIYSR